MLIRLSKRSRIYATAVLALVYCFFVVLPAFASPFVGDVSVVDDITVGGCLTHMATGFPTDADDVVANDDDGIAWKTDQSDMRASRCGTCCGLSCGCYGLCDLALLSRYFSDVSSRLPSKVIARLQQDVERQTAAFIDRPPKFVISL